MNCICEKSLYDQCSCKTNYHLPMSLPLYDGHCHLDLFFNNGLNATDFNDRLLAKRKMIFIDNRHHFHKWFVSHEFINLNAKIYRTYGLHPKHLPSNLQKAFEQLHNIFTNHANLSFKTVGIGECGLDDTSKYSYDLQLHVFQFQLKLAAKLQLPLVIHGRGIHSFRKILNELMIHLNPLHKIHWHCVNASSDLNVISDFIHYFNHSYIGLNGSIFSQNDVESQKTFNKWLIAQDNILSKIIIETDYPFLRPFVLEQQQYNPISGIIHTAQQIVNILRKKNTNTTKVIDQSNHNIRQMYSID